MAQRNIDDRNTDDGETTEDTFDEIVDAGLAPGASTGALSQSEAETQRDEFRAQLQRAQADYQNLRRRLQSDIDSAVARSKGPLLQDLLLVLDYLDLALAVPTTSPEAKNLHAGVEMTKGQLVRALEREGVKPVPESGAFDAALHDAVESVPTSESEPNTILATFRKGYTQNGAVLRPAQVKVAVAPNARTHRGET
jgi:molecular chaperone GrpE